MGITSVYIEDHAGSLILQFLRERKRVSERKKMCMRERGKTMSACDENN